MHDREEIERRLRLRLIPETDRRDALIELGFTRVYPQLAQGPYYRAMWTRAIEATATGSGHRTLALARISRGGLSVRIVRNLGRQALRPKRGAGTLQ